MEISASYPRAIHFVLVTMTTFLSEISWLLEK